MKFSIGLLICCCLTVHASEFAVPKRSASAKELKADGLGTTADCLEIGTELARVLNKQMGTLIDLLADLQGLLKAGVGGEQDCAINSSSKSERATYLKQVQEIETELHKQLQLAHTHVDQLKGLKQKIKPDVKNLNQITLKGI